jgi:hypothetical protein
MPRAKKTRSGDPAQKVESVAGQRYGEGVAQQQMQKAMPAPNVRAGERPMQSVPVAPSIPSGPMEQTVPQPRVNPADFLAGLPRKTLADPTMNTRPVTNGLRTGPGQGPEALRPFAQAAPALRSAMRLADRTGDPVFQQILRRFS